MVRRSLVLVGRVSLLVGCGTNAMESSEYQDLEASFEQAVLELTTLDRCDPARRTTVTVMQAPAGRCLRR